MGGVVVVTQLERVHHIQSRLVACKTHCVRRHKRPPGDSRTSALRDGAIRELTQTTGEHLFSLRGRYLTPAYNPPRPGRPRR